MKKEVLQTIYSCFETWADSESFICFKGCASCCTQNVTATSLEVAVVLDHIIKEQKEDWFGERLKKVSSIEPPIISTNEFALACMEDKDVDPGNFSNFEACPFLKENLCTIYEVRPFGCRCFNSRKKCSAGGAAEVPEYYLSASSTVQQLIEHLDQGWYWGNFLDVIFAMAGTHDYSFLKKYLNEDDIEAAVKRVRKASPLPGFLYAQDEAQKIEPLLQTIFSAKCGKKTVEDVLNGK